MKDSGASTQPQEKDATLNDQEIFEKVAINIAEIIGIPNEKVTIESHLVNDLGADSLDLVEGVVRIEDEFDVEITDEETENAKTVKEIIELLKKKLKD